MMRSQSQPVFAASQSTREAENTAALEPLPLATTVREETYRITLCGSTRFRAEYELWNRRLSMAGFLVYSVSCFGHSGDPLTDEEKARLDRVHLAKIDASHAIVVVGDGYVGESTRREIEHAFATGKEVYSTAHGLDLPRRLADRVAYVYGLRTGPDGTASLRYRAFSHGNSEPTVLSREDGSEDGRRSTNGMNPTNLPSKSNGEGE